jgi:hypothetical protein
MLSGEGDIGCIFEEISNPVETIRPGRPNGRPRMGGLGRLAKEGVVSPEQPGRRRR